MNRPTKDEYYLDIAKVVAERGTCLRRNYGAVIVKKNSIVSTGYSGPPQGVAHCVTCKREELNIPSGQRYDLCRSVHAEQNAIIKASMEEMDGATMYINGIAMDEHHPITDLTPCYLCRRMILNSGIAEVVTLVGGNVTFLYRHNIIDMENL
jgi:dCMP deaminase